ncbi:hypothetical protein yc1106_07693 [Curvularia clavata]|uniref:Uncharacterized protein n=1 Tax=Curvularia clavata TaxID=95742 RepID=A0A9Q8ZFD1_CURCL|nr:hypothetical protein yc1106_07693 [Curvularia clavata]
MSTPSTDAAAKPEDDENFIIRGLPDTESRYWLQTETKTGHWDQVVGISQGIINSNFEQLFKLYSADMADMYSSVDDVGRIDARMLAPRLLIPGGKSSRNNELIYQLRFEFGSMYNSAGKALIEDLTGWVISVPVTLDIKPEVLDSKTNPSPEAIENNKKQHDFVKNQFNLAGDYSIERLYAKLSSARWNQFIPEHSIAGLTDKGEEIPLINWQLSNSELWLKLTNWLSYWAAQQDLKGRNLIGVSFQLPKEPTDMMHQTYPYRCVPRQVPVGVEGFTGAGTRNALLYCEKIKGNPRPDDTSMVWSGNFTTQPSTLDANDAIDGTFLLGRHVFMEEYLLPQLKRLNQASEIFFEKPYGELQNNNVYCITPFKVGIDPKTPVFTDKVYNFTNINPKNKRNQESGYRFIKINETEELTYDNHARNKPSLKAQVRTSMTPEQIRTSLTRANPENDTAEMKVDVKWATGTPKLTVTGETLIKENLRWDQGTEPTNWNSLWAWVYDEYTVTWKLELEISTKKPPTPEEKEKEVNPQQPTSQEQDKADAGGLQQNGVLDIKIVSGPDLDVKWKPDQVHIKDDDKRDEIKSRVTKQFTDNVPVIIGNVKQQLEGAGRFVFPGNGVFDFTDPRFTQWGDLVAKIDYKPLKRNVIRFLPRGAKIKDTKPPDDTTLKPGTGYTPGEYRLSWIRSVTTVGAKPDAYPADTVAPGKPMKITLRGINNKPDKLVLKEIRIMFSAEKKDRALFYEPSFEIVREEALTKPDDKKHTPQQPGGAPRPSSSGPIPGAPTPQAPATGTPNAGRANTGGATTGNTTGGSTTYTSAEQQSVTPARPSQTTATTASAEGPTQAPNGSAATAIDSALSLDLTEDAADTAGPAGSAGSSVTAPKDEQSTPEKSGSILGHIKDKILGKLDGDKPGIDEDRTKPDYKKPTAPVAGAVRFSQSKTKKEVVVRLDMIGQQAKLNKWQVSLDGPDNTLELEPGEWVEVTLTGRSNISGPGYYYDLEEDWPEEGQHLRTSYNVDVADD